MCAYAVCIRMNESVCNLRLRVLALLGASGIGIVGRRAGVSRVGQMMIARGERVRHALINTQCKLAEEEKTELMDLYLDIDMYQHAPARPTHIKP